MDGIQLALPRPGPVVHGLLVARGVTAIIEGILYTWVNGGAFLSRLWIVREEMRSQPWSIVTAFFLSDPTNYSHVLFSLIGLYFIGTAMEQHWGTARFLRFVGVTAIASYAVGIGIALLSPAGLAIFHPKIMLGPDAVLTALALAFGREFPTRIIRLFFFIPVSGKLIVWLTVGFSFLGLVFPTATYEGAATRIGAIGFGFLLAGTPSPMRALYLRAKLFFLRRGSQGPRIDVEARPAKRRATGGPPLRVVQGGLDDDELSKRRPPKDKRYLN